MGGSGWNLHTPKRITATHTSSLAYSPHPKRIWGDPVGIFTHRYTRPTIFKHLLGFPADASRSLALHTNCASYSCALDALSSSHCPPSLHSIPSHTSLDTLPRTAYSPILHHTLLGMSRNSTLASYTGHSYYSFKPLYH